MSVESFGRSLHDAKLGKNDKEWFRHKALETERAYVGWVQRLIAHCDSPDLAKFGEREIKAFLTDLAVGRNVTAGTQNQAKCALLFLYKTVLGRELAFLDAAPASKSERFQDRTGVARAQGHAYDDDLFGWAVPTRHNPLWWAQPTLRFSAASGCAVCYFLPLAFREGYGGVELPDALVRTRAAYATTDVPSSTACGITIVVSRRAS